MNGALHLCDGRGKNAPWAEKNQVQRSLISWGAETLKNSQLIGICAPRVQKAPLNGFFLLINQEEIEF